ncbi:MAG: hypothetical protein ACLT1T_07615 [Oscillospiraceae bacterium]
MKKKQTMEDVVHGVFLFLGLITVGCVLLITVYLIVSGLPAILKIGLGKFLFGSEWASTAAEAKFGILPFILTSVYGTCGAILISVPVGFLTAVFLSKMAPKSSVPSWNRGQPARGHPVGRLWPCRHAGAGAGDPEAVSRAGRASLLAAIIVLAIMILPSIIKVSVNALDAVRRSMKTRLWPSARHRRDLVPRVGPGGQERHRGRRRARRRPGHRRGHGRHDGLGQRAEHAVAV